MCRFVAYFGEPILMNEVISKPRDSLIKQSAGAQESDITINGDGFGIGWYNPQVSDIPAVFVSILPAWNDLNLRNISHQVLSPCFFGHVRAAMVGSVTHDNCHPFAHAAYLFMHNGGIGGFLKIKRDLLNLLSEDSFEQIRGQTDSELMFALWRTYFFAGDATLPNAVSAWRKTLTTIKAVQEKHAIREPSYINAVVSDGKSLVAVRSSSDPNYHLSLHYTAGKAFTHTKEGCHMIPVTGKANPSAVIIASEKLTAYPNEWQDVPAEHVMTVDAHKHIAFHRL